MFPYYILKMLTYLAYIHPPINLIISPTWLYTHWFEFTIEYPKFEILEVKVVF